MLRAGNRPWGVENDPARGRWPRALAFLTERQTVKGKTRELPRVVMKATPTGWQLEVTDYLISYKLTVAFDNAEDWLQALENGLADPNANWQPVKVGEGYSKRRSLETKKLDLPEDDI